MKRIIYLSIVCISAMTYLTAQNRIVLYNGGNIVKSSLTSAIDSIKLQNQYSIFNYTDNTAFSLPVSEIDSITFSTEDVATGNVVYIVFDGTTASIINPFEGNGVTVTTTNALVSVTSTATETIKYHVSGTTPDGGLTITSSSPIALTLSNVNISNSTSAAVNIASKIDAEITVSGTSILSDNAASTINATLFSKGAITISGNGSLTVNGYYKHGIGSSNSYVKINNGTVNILQAATDGIHSEGFEMNGGTLNISPTDGDGIDAGGDKIYIYGGNINVNSTAEDVKAIKSDSTITIGGGNISLTVGGNASKGISSKSNVVINGGTIDITASGTVLLEAVGSGYDPSYCSAIKCDGNFIVNDGDITIITTSSNIGGKGFSADGNIEINGGTINITCNGNGATYTDENGAKDSYTACAIKSDTNIYLNTGNITCLSTGTGGKGVSADGILTIGILNADNSDLILNVNTTGARFYVSGTGNNADYANPKAVKSEGNLTVNSGTTTISCTQSDEGGEGLESKATLTINGGINTISTYDDCVNASNHIEITGGTNYFVSKGNDAVDSNGTLTISGGFSIVGGTRSPEGGIDCDNNTFKMNGGTVISTGGATSNPTTNSSSQNSLKYTGTAGNAVCIKNSSGTAILMYQMPTYSTNGSGGGPGGGGNSSSMVLLFSSSELTNGSYTLQYGGTITGGTTVNGYTTGGAYSGGSSRTFTVSSKLTTVQ